ncbi:hypothetical protein O6H91_01G119100 [Diphasiastrum complanatum]|uniref:Uncharacterized protein n=1 Tax=Diphasiastrum complanatum TaxID=34168 RepID=A0ACC2EVE9_DIPCM|nr:hypothetical protein O6H91_Y219800 [Diphasiastrum complanatum]KAJ7570413.1 hypothetical protein O6H91_01G119100 [Diphasiastrum complanatum]
MAVSLLLQQCIQLYTSHLQIADLTFCKSMSMSESTCKCNSSTGDLRPVSNLLHPFRFHAEDVVESKKVVQLHWYMHDTPFNGPAPSAVPVTAYNASDFQNELKNFLFGQIYVFDDPLTQQSPPTSASFGRAQGTYSFVSREEFVAYVSYTVTIQTGTYKGSTLNILGANPNAKPVKTCAIAGGTGHFILARGILTSQVLNLFGPFNASATLLNQATIYLD